LPADLPAAIFVVQHTAPHALGQLDSLLTAAGPLPAKYAEEGERIVPGRIYLAVADHHLLVKKDHVRVTRGPRENRVRPAVDALFRSAAAAHGSNLISVILSGMDDDGASGTQAVKRCGGVTIVQDPEEAASPEMPRAAIDAGGADCVLPLARIGETIDRLAREEHPAGAPIPEDVILEAQIAERAMRDESTLERLGPTSQYSCPQCGGLLRQINDDPVIRFRCQTGHGFTARSLLVEQNDATERALWAAIRVLEERSLMLGRMASAEMERGRTRTAPAYEREAADARTHANALRELLLGLSGGP
jgi:two-component system chemotaxis response regulator CheB